MAKGTCRLSVGEQCSSVQAACKEEVSSSNCLLHVFFFSFHCTEVKNILFILLVK